MNRITSYHYSKSPFLKSFIRSICLFSLLFFALLVSGCISPAPDPIGNSQNASITTGITVTDAFGNTMTFPHTVHRIICLPGTAAETLVSIGAGNQIIGVSEMTREDTFLMSHLPNAESVGDYWIPDIEKIITLQPDVVISYGISQSKPKNYDKILAAGIPVLYVKCYDIQDLSTETRMLGVITGHEKKAEEIARFTEHYLGIITSRLANVSQINYKETRVYIERWTDYTAMAGDSPFQNLVVMLHAKNIAENISMVQSKVSPEWLINQDPDVIIRLALDGENATIIRNNLISRTEAARIQAVQNGKIYVVYTDLLTSPRAITGTLYIAKELYPDRFSDINPDIILQDYIQNFLPGFYQKETYYPPSSNQIISGTNQSNNEDFT